MARYIFHIGMGKTGTTSIQHTLRSHPDELSANGIHYLGMQFAPFVDAPSIAQLSHRSGAAQRAAAKRLIEQMEEAATRRGIGRYVLSNEAIFAQSELVPFFETFAAHADVTIVAAFRSVHSWLRSAYAQWGMRHKVVAGRVQPFRQRAEDLLDHYAAAPLWLKAFGERMVALDYDRHDDITTAFLDALDLPSACATHVRHLERPGNVELLFRSAFNDLHRAPMPPKRFNDAVGQEPFREPDSVSDYMERLLSEEGLADVLARARPTLREVSERTGIDLLAAGGPPRPVDSGELERRTVHALVRTTMEQARRIQALEERVRSLSDGMVAVDSERSAGSGSAL